MNIFENCLDLINDILMESQTTRHNARMKKAKQKVQSFLDRQNNFQNYMKQGMSYEDAIKKAKIGSKTEEPNKVEGGYAWTNPNSGVVYKVEVDNKRIEPNKNDNVINFKREQIAKRINEILPTANVRQTADGKNIIGDPKKVEEIMDLKKQLEDLKESIINERTPEETLKRAKWFIKAANGRIEDSQKYRIRKNAKDKHAEDVLNNVGRVYNKNGATLAEIEDILKDMTKKGASINKVENPKIQERKKKLEETKRKKEESDYKEDILYQLGGNYDLQKEVSQKFKNLISNPEFQNADKEIQRAIINNFKDQAQQYVTKATQRNREEGYKKSAQSNAQRKKENFNPTDLENKIKNTVLANAAAQAEETGKAVPTEFGMKNPLKFKNN